MSGNESTIESLTAVAQVSLAPELFIPLAPGLRALPAGTAVRAGDLVGRDIGPTGIFSAEKSSIILPHAPTAGVISGEKNIHLTSGLTTPAAVLQTGGYQHEVSPRVVTAPFTEQLRDLLKVRAEGRAALFAALLTAGVQADRPTCPDLIGQLRASLVPVTGVDTVLCTALDPDPHLAISAQLADEAAPDLVIGALLAAMISGARRLLLIIEPTVPSRTKRELTRLAAEITRAAYQHHAGLTCRAIAYANHYPRGDTSLLLLRVLNRKLPPPLLGPRLPVTQGVVLVDTPAAVAMGRSLRMGQPLTHIPLALAHHSADNTRATSLHRIPIGTPVAHLVSQMNLAAPAGYQLRTNDILQERLAPADAVISTCDLYLHVLPAKPTGSAAPPPPDPCIRCGWCVEACPTRVHPAALLEASQTRNMAMADRANLRSCIECGLCQYVCPSRLPLLTAIRSLAKPEGK